MILKRSITDFSYLYDGTFNNNDFLKMHKFSNNNN